MSLWDHLNFGTVASSVFQLAGAGAGLAAGDATGEAELQSLQTTSDAATAAKDAAEAADAAERASQLADTDVGIDADSLEATPEGTATGLRDLGADNTRERVLSDLQEKAKAASLSLESRQKRFSEEAMSRGSQAASIGGRIGEPLGGAVDADLSKEREDEIYQRQVNPRLGGISAHAAGMGNDDVEAARKRAA